MGMNIKYEQDSKEWVVELKENWNIYEYKDEKDLTEFLRKNTIPYSVDYVFEGVNISLTILKQEKDFNKILAFVNELLTLQEKIMKITPLNPLKPTEVETKSGSKPGNIFFRR